ncbi:MAG: glycosyltransferase [Chloroflexota bacterium]|nr:glycosyltransferase [Chloroflexota bacterium]
MRIAILALGSRGDVQPFIALGLGLQAAGHSVRIAAAEDYGDLVRAYGLPFTPVGGSIRRLMDRALVYPVLTGGANPLPMVRAFRKGIQPFAERILTDCIRACAGAECLVAGALGVFPGYSISDALGLPCVVVHLHPDSPTRTMPHPFLPPLPRGVPGRGLYNRLTWPLGVGVLWHVLLGPINRARQQLGLPPLTLRGVARHLSERGPVLCAYSPTLAPRPPDWATGLQITGDWPLAAPPGWQPPPDLVRFLAAGPPPIYLSFGSILAGSDPDAVTALLVAALALAGQRGLIASGWDDLGHIALPPTVLKVGSVPHDWLFPQVAAVVHHGGAGTTAATVRAGRPAVVVPFFGDQFFWAERLARLGAAITLPRTHLTAARLTADLRRVVGDPHLCARAAVLRRRVQGEAGVAQAVRVITECLVFSV